ncbi:hypothetical protein R1sor_005898 [Riccia sorocarpa]|uniref:Uncharacterized protein n=1 Tax=Riccia sorocarpa TaxID=122646 RepID=A0ABD3HPE6_9MARC
MASTSILPLKRSVPSNSVSTEDITQGGCNIGIEGLECYALSAYGNYLRVTLGRMDNGRDGDFRALHCDVTDKECLNTITVSCTDPVTCDTFATQLRRGNYLKISNFTLSSKSRKRFEKGDLKTIIKLNPSSKVAVAHAWNPPARPIFFPKDTVASLRLRMQMRYETGDVAVVCIGDIGENNCTYRINVTDGMADEDTMHVILDGSFHQDYETLHRKFTIELVGIDDIGPHRNPLQVPAAPTIPLIEDVPRQIEHCIATNLEDTGSTTYHTSEYRMEEGHEVTKEERSKESMEEGDNI